ncbi:MAG: prenyltransferase [Oscillospiraceae bacterium]|nr:prenyltransferase [Oscillospiraceae bacterium]
MLKRLNIYFKEMYPFFTRLLLGFIVFGEIYFILLLNYGVTDFSLGIQEIVGGITVFGFLMFLRIADDFKDYESDKRLFPDRAFPSGKVYKKDLNIVVAVDLAVLTILNAVFMNNFLFYLFLMAYGILMSLWFFQKHKISKSLPLALVTHNPVQMVLNLYIISFCCIKYDLYPFTLTSFLVLMTLYFPALIWEIARKIRAPKDETEYTTYSKLFGHKKSTIFILILTLVDIVTNLILVYRLNMIGFVILIINVAVMTIQFIMFIKNPERFKLVTRVEIYTYITEATMLLIIPAYMIFGRI